MATYATLTVNAEDIIGADFDKSRASAYIEAGGDDGVLDAINVDNTLVRIGGRRESPDSSGTITFANLVTTNSAANPATFSYRVKIIYTPKGSRRQGHDEWVSAWFPLTASANLGEIDAAFDNVAAPVSWRSDFRNEMTLLRTQTQAARDAAAALVVSDLGTTDGQTTALVQTPTSATAKALSATYAGRWDGSKLVCLGDSITEGNQDGSGTRYPSLLATALPWATVTNAGKSGWTSTEVAARWGAPFTLDGFTLPAGTTQTAVTITAPTTTYRSSSSGTYSWTGELRSAAGTLIAAGTLNHDATGTDPLAGWTFARTTAGSSVAVTAGAQFVCTEFETLKNATLIIGFGRNNILDPAVIVRDVNAIRAAHKAPGAPFLVLSTPTLQSEIAGTQGYSRVKSINAALVAAFPNEFVNDRRYLVDRALKITGTTPTAGDVTAVLADTMPASIMFDDTHPNATGYKAKTAAVIEGLTRVGATPGPTSTVTGVTPTALVPMIWDAADVDAPLGSTINRLMDRSNLIPLISAATSAAPQLVEVGGRRALKFDGVDDRMYGLTGNMNQPITVIAKVRFRDLSTVAQGVFYTYDVPGATFSVSTSGRVVLNAALAVQTAAGVITANTVVTIAGVINGATSAAGIAGSTLTTGDAGTRGILTQFIVGRFGTTDYASIDLFHMRVYPYALTEAQVTTVAAQIG